MPRPSSTAARLAPWAVATVATAVALWALFAAWSDPEQPGAPVQRFSIIVPEDQLLPVRNSMLAISPAGTDIVYAAESGGTSRLYRRPVDGLLPEPIEGTEGADEPVFALDGDSVAFRQGNAVRALSMDGGPVQTLCAPCVAEFGFAWAPDGTVLATSDWAQPLQVIAGPRAAGPITELDVTRGDVTHLWPQFLPDGESALFTIWTPTNTYAAIVFLNTGAVHTVAEGGEYYRYMEPGYLLSGRDGVLVAEAFDLESLQTSGPQVAVAANITMAPEEAFVYYGVSSSGLLVYREGTPMKRIVWISRDDGEIADAWPRTGRFNSVRASHAGDYLAVDVQPTVGGYAVWLLDMEAGTHQVLSSGADDLSPLFSPDDTTVVYTSVRPDGGYSLVAVSVDGTRGLEEWLQHDSYVEPVDWSLNGEYIAYYIDEQGSDLWLLPTDGGESFRVTEGAFNETSASISPDSKWIAFTTDRSGQDNVWVASIENPISRPQQITFDGATHPQWNPLGDEIYYRRGTEIRAQPVTIDTSFRLAGEFRVVTNDRRLYPDGFFHVSPDGQRLLIARYEDAGLEEHYLNVILNLPALLEREGGR